MVQSKTKQLTILAMLSALAFLLTAFGRIPMVLFLKYDPKDVIILIAGFIYGPVSSIVISFLVSLVEMVTISDTGFIGFIMNVLSTLAFVIPATYLYHRYKSFASAAIGLFLGVVLMTGIMILWNYLLTPLFMGIPREEVIKLLVPVILPFNIIKGSINAALSIFLYKPVVRGLRKMKYIPPSTGSQSTGKIRVEAYVVAAVILTSALLLALVISGKL
ncbi:MAG: ECF transporter S component [Tissierellia bacterium]|jgi:riboflavin transporter FmnP|nr:ECF transporter S component [Tissierellia bacterium]